MSKDEIIKHDKNFMEYPLWFQNVKLAEKSKDGYVWKDLEGYTYRAGYKPPVKKDFLYLLYFLMICQEKGWQDKFYLTRAQVLKGCGLRLDKREYDRLEDGLERWENVRIRYSGTFYDGKNYKTLSFGIIDSWGIEKESKRLWIRLSPEWLLQQKESRMFELINFAKIKQLSDPLATRLYEILIKQFYNRREWRIDAVKLAKKIPLERKYPSDITPKIQTAIKRITKNTDIAVNLTVDKQPGKHTYTFTLKHAKLKQMPLFPNIPGSEPKRPQPGEWIYIQGRSYQVAKDRSVSSNDYGHFSEKKIIQGFEDGSITRASNK